MDWKTIGHSVVAVAVAVGTFFPVIDPNPNADMVVRYVVGAIVAAGVSLGVWQNQQLKALKKASCVSCGKPAFKAAA